MAGEQRVISARDVDVYITFDVVGIPTKIKTASNITVNIAGNTEDIGAISTDEPIATDNGGNTYDISIALQIAETHTLKDALAAASANLDGGAIAHIRQIVEAATISLVWKKKRDVPPVAIAETYTFCTGVEEGDNVERRSTETMKNWRFRSRGMTRQTAPISELLTGLGIA